jgi:hypothetical protein
MRTLKHLVILSLVAFVAVFVAAPSALAKKALSEDEMDLITAAGQPKIIQTGTGEITFFDGPVNSLILGTDSQSSLSALTLNNVVGEVQLANAINVTAAIFAAGSEQTNTITQSWGATKDWTSSTVAGVSATAASSASAAASSTASCFKCGVVRSGNAAASTAAAAAASTSPGSNKILTKYADQIIESVSGDVFVEQNGTSSLILEGTAQTTLSALVVNNIVGLSQVANAINIMGNSVNANPGLPAFQVNPATELRAAASQSNTINQFRGTPFSRPAAP